MGKGGVGKSTSTALNALYLARKGYDVVIVSLDPAHNQADIFQKPLSNRAERVAPNLRVVEVDQDYWVKRYLKGIHDQINSTYRYLTSFNLEKYFKVIKHSPGLEEHALILAFEEAKRKFAKCDFLVFDMAPTAISLKFFSLPSLSLVWIDHLAALREEVIEKRELITKIKVMSKEIETDKVLSKIGELREQHTVLKERFQDSGKTKINLVLNPDELSLAESKRISAGLDEVGINVTEVVVNKDWQGASLDQIEEEFKGVPIFRIPWSSTPLVGEDALVQFLQEHQDRMEDQAQQIIGQ